jgi:RHS repeat-associated protein
MDNIYEYTYDNLSSFKKEVPHNNSKISYKEGNNIYSFSYDAFGNLTQFKDNKNNSRYYEYDNLNRLVKIINPFGNYEIYEYDKIGNRTRYKDALGNEKTFVFDELNRPIKILYNKKIIKEFSYDAIGNIIIAQSKYDRVNNKIKILYNKNQKKEKIIYPNDIIVTYAYKNTGELFNLKIQKDKKIIYKEEYAFDKNGNISSKKTNEILYKYTYDKESRLTEVLKNEKKIASYNYDDNGNILQINNIKFKYDINNQLIKNDAEIFQYDALGNLVQRKSKNKLINYVYDSDNYLIKVLIDNKIVSEFTYDLLGRLYSINNKHYFVYDRLNISAIINNKKIKNFILGNNLDEIYAVQDSDKITYFIRDSLGNIIFETDSSGKILKEFDYDPFGNFEKTNKEDFIFSYNSSLYDNKSNLYYFRNRWYDPKLARFLSPDPIDINGGFNLYQYANNNPLKFSDPLGLINVTRPVVPKTGDKNKVGLVNINAIQEGYPSLPTFPNPGDINGYGVSLGRTPQGIATFVNLNYPYYPGNGYGDGFNDGITQLKNLGILGNIFSRNLLNDSTIRENNDNTLRALNSSKIMQLVARSPITFASNIGRWLWQNDKNIYYYLFPKRDDPYFTTPRIGVLDFLNSKGNLGLSRALAFGANIDMNMASDSDRISPDPISNLFKRLEIKFNDNSYSIEDIKSEIEILPSAPEPDHIINTECK